MNQHSPFKYSEEKLCGYTAFSANMSNHAGRQMFYQEPLVTIIGLNDSSCQYIDIESCAFQVNHANLRAYPITAFGKGDDLFVGFAYCDNITHVKSNKKNKKIYLGSKMVSYTDTFPVSKANNINFQAEFMMKTSYYGEILYDLYRNYIYRIAYGAMDNAVDSEGRLLSNKFKPWSIVRMDLNSNILLECDMTGSNLSPTYLSVTEEGLRTFRYGTSPLEYVTFLLE